jgi:endonuclease/exonuclease/phosphatase family metal-dependent hydrolase
MHEGGPPRDDGPLRDDAPLRDGGPPPAQGAGVRAPGRVATWNLRHGLGPDGRVDLARTAAGIAALRADVIGLQEVDVAFGPRSGHEDQAARLAALLGMRMRFGAALDLPPLAPGGPRRRYGSALLSPHEIEDAHWQPLPHHPGIPAPHEPRGLLAARIRRAEGAALRVLVTHLDNAERRHRTAQVQGIVRLAAPLERGEETAVLMGDMNAAPSAPELAALAATGWREAAQQLRADGARRAGRLTHPARFPLRRLDSLWVRGPVEVQALETAPRAGSDHRAVIATLRT